jgi:hypothetical protein
MVRTAPLPAPKPAAAGFVTVIASAVPGVAVELTVIVAVIVLALTTVTLPKVTLAGPLTVAPATKLVPVIVTELVLPRAALPRTHAADRRAGDDRETPGQDGLACVGVGQRDAVAAQPRCLGDGELRRRSVADVIVTRVTFTDVAGAPVCDTFTFMPLTNPPPVRETVRTAPLPSDEGDSEVSTGRSSTTRSC